MMWNHGSTSWNPAEPRDRGAVRERDRHRHASGTQAVDRAAAPGRRRSSSADEPLTFADLQEACGLAKSTTSRLLAALERSGLLERDDAGSLRRRPPVLAVRRPARPVGGAGPPGPPDAWSAIGEDTHETVHLSVARGDRVVQVAQVDSPLPARHPRLDRDRRARPLLGARQGVPRLGRRSTCPTGRSSSRPPATLTDADGAARATASATRAPRLGRHRRRARGRPHRRRRPGPRPARRRRRRARASRAPPHGWRTGSTSSAASCSTSAAQLSTLLAARQHTTQGGRRHDHSRRDPAGPLRRDARRQRPARARADRGGPGARHGAADAALRRADPLARGGRRAVRARRLLRARDADRRPGDGRRDGAAAAAARRDRRRRPSASS